MARRASKKTPIVIRDTLYTNDPDSTGMRLDSDEWLAWLELRQTFYVTSGGFTVRAEKRRGQTYWYAVKKIDGRAVRRYLGKLPTADALARLAEFAGDTPRVTDTP